MCLDSMQMSRCFSHMGRWVSQLQDRMEAPFKWSIKGLAERQDGLQEEVILDVQTRTQTHCNGEDLPFTLSFNWCLGSAKETKQHAEQMLPYGATPSPRKAFPRMSQVCLLKYHSQFPVSLLWCLSNLPFGFPQHCWSAIVLKTISLKGRKNTLNTNISRQGPSDNRGPSVPHVPSSQPQNL